MNTHVEALMRGARQLIENGQQPRPVAMPVQDGKRLAVAVAPAFDKAQEQSVWAQIGLFGRIVGAQGLAVVLDGYTRVFSDIENALEAAPPSQDPAAQEALIGIWAPKDSEPEVWVLVYRRDDWGNMEFEEPVKTVFIKSTPAEIFKSALEKKENFPLPIEEACKVMEGFGFDTMKTPDE